MKAVNLDMGPPLVTAVRLWLFGRNKGAWDGKIDTTCSWCGGRFPVQEGVLNAINTITSSASLSPDQSPCLHLPPEAWDDSRVLSECPLCHKPLRFNPFVVDNKHRY